MQVPLEITFRDVEHDPSLEELIRTKAAGLDKVCGRITRCRVAVERPHRSERSGNPYRVRIDVTVPPGAEIVVDRSPGKGELHEALETVIKDAFQAGRRQLQELAERRSGKVKTHEPPTALIVRLFPERGYGFLKTLEGRDIYFHRNSVADEDFERLSVGTAVRFEETEGDKGPQATTVQIIDKPGERHEKAAAGAENEPPLGWEE